jgi:NAD(P)-dependent dehydrogenase (short-subunit alcohol dehydrogenase family)
MIHATPDPRAAEAPAVLVTGAAAGIGRAAALRLAHAGWRCVLVDANAEALQRLQADWPQTAPPPLGLVADLTDAAQIARLAQAVPPLDALINNAGLSAGGAGALSGSEDGAAARLLALNLAAPARLVQACAPRLQPGARIVNVASGAGLRAIPWRGLYSPSKAGLIAQTRALARARPGWSVTALSPGFVRTELVQGLIDSGRLNLARALAKVPLGRMAEPLEMADALCFLASPAARLLTGQLLVLDGGSSIYGGSEALPAAERPVLPFDLPMALRCVDLRAPAWGLAVDEPANDAAYQAVLDGAALDAAPGALLETVLRSARRFRESRDARASLTLLLPPPASDLPWEQAGDAAAAHMLIATLAAEWGARGLRINALELAESTAPGDCRPLLHYVAGARAQFLTGQVLKPGAAPH